MKCISNSSSVSISVLICNGFIESADEKVQWTRCPDNCAHSSDPAFCECLIPKRGNDSAVERHPVGVENPKGSPSFVRQVFQHIHKKYHLTMRSLIFALSPTSNHYANARLNCLQPKGLGGHSNTHISILLHSNE
ncbi:hypothetical protein AVEN_185104-1 [Araneus ventricosus]|uniref:Uncharacterized protein n=1 Tax=Araneus ventricosus TaxID=182803 RepID=A0A4Y2T4S4_ARAVE|nr:hypothetical protein AVEN_185104-1 [Araneus ventricosus]